MSLQKRLNRLLQEIVAALCNIKEFPDGLLPHTVYVEEESENSMAVGNTVFNTYSLIKIFPDGSCVLENPATGEVENRQLSEINIDWLMLVWDYYKDLSGFKETQPVKKELFAFLYPLDHFERNVSDEEILGGWADGYVEKYTPDEFAELINDEAFDDLSFWVRFLEVDA